MVPVPVDPTSTCICMYIYNCIYMYLYLHGQLHLQICTFSGQSKMGIFNFTRTLNLFCNNFKYFKAEFY